MLLIDPNQTIIQVLLLIHSQKPIQILRDSFAYAKELLEHIRATKRSWPLPIILVANKIDLERARVVKREGKWSAERA